MAPIACILIIIVLFAAGVWWEFACRENLRELRGNDHWITRTMDSNFPPEHAVRRTGGLINQMDAPGDMTQLHYFVFSGNMEGMRALLKSGADVNVTDSDGDTPLIVCAMHGGSCSTAKELLESGARIDATNLRGQTALSGAVAAGHTELVKTLIAAGADVQRARYEDRYTPLMLAARQGNAEMVEALLEAGADMSAMSSDARTALHVAPTSLAPLLQARQQPTASDAPLSAHEAV